MAKHYVRVDEEDKIVHGFSSDFEKPLDTDICINENGGRQFELLGVMNPILVRLNGVHLYRLVTTITEEQVPIVEDVTDELNVNIDTSNVSLEDSEAVLTDVVVNKDITATATGYKTLYHYHYSVRHSTNEEMEEELLGFPEVTPEKNDSEKIMELEKHLTALEEQNTMLTECLLEMSEVVYGG